MSFDLRQSTKVAWIPRGEELANSISHGLGLLGSVAAIPILVIGAVERGGPIDVVGSSIFGVSMVFLYLASTWYHVMPVGKVKERLQRFDHAAIYVLIAGTYTPFTFGVLGGVWGWTLFGLVWGSAVIGVVVKIVYGAQYSRFSTSMYLVMGWLVVIAAKPLLSAMPAEGIGWLLAGGLFYSVGVVFFVAHKLPYSHFVWHLFVLAGTICHFFAVLWFAV
ncbi:MAG: hemolysin III family protein [Rhodothermales bacterium]|jgi:hemolysin III|nr:hemolysin III family protein [Rhodothermales bacterium]MDG2015940.1 hemolysin III family protein [Rhodothermales bacterium]